MNSCCQYASLVCQCYDLKYGTTPRFTKFHATSGHWWDVLVNKAPPHRPDIESKWGGIIQRCAMECLLGIAWYMLYISPLIYLLAPSLLLCYLHEYGINTSSDRKQLPHEWRRWFNIIRNPYHRSARVPDSGYRLHIQGLKCGLGLWPITVSWSVMSS